MEMQAIMRKVSNILFFKRLLSESIIFDMVLPPNPASTDMPKVYIETNL